MVREAAHRNSCWTDRSSTTLPSNRPWRWPNCPNPRWPDVRPSSSSPTSTPATTPTRPSSDRPARSPSVRSCKGLNKPVNDLSRGALVDDIVNTDRDHGHPGHRHRVRQRRVRRRVDPTHDLGDQLRILVPEVPTHRSSDQVPLASGLVERIGESDGVLTHRRGDRRSSRRGAIPDHEAALAATRRHAFVEIRADAWRTLGAGRIRPSDRARRRSIP